MDARFREIFGDSDDEVEDVWPSTLCSCYLCTSSGKKPLHWKNVKEVCGLWLCENFLDGYQHEELLKCIEKEGWFSVSNANQAMRFFDLPSWTQCLGRTISRVIPSSHGDLSKQNTKHWSDVFCREPVFDQMIVNSYEPGEGIKPHVDLLKFKDGIAVVSLLSSCVMTFTKSNLTASNEVEKIQNSAQNSNSGEFIPKKAKMSQPWEVKSAAEVNVFLEEKSLLLITGEARFEWKHGISRGTGEQIWEGREMEQKRRISITLRKMCEEQA